MSSVAGLFCSSGENSIWEGHGSNRESRAGRGEASVRALLRELVETSGRYCCVGAYDNARTALLEIPSVRPILVLMDIRLGRLSGIDCTRELKRLNPKLKVLIVTALSDATVLASAIQAGADGYLLKPFNRYELFRAMGDVLAGRTPVTPSMFEKIPSLISTERFRSDVISKLTPRQIEIVRLLAKGFLYKEIADELGIQNSTVTQHLHAIYGRLGVTTRHQAIEVLQGRNSGS